MLAMYAVLESSDIENCTKSLALPPGRFEHNQYDEYSIQLTLWGKCTDIYTLASNKNQNFKCITIHEKCTSIWKIKSGEAIFTNKLVAAAPLCDKIGHE